MNSAVDEMDLPVGAVARAINLRLNKKRLATRPGVTAVPLTGDEAVVELLRYQNPVNLPDYSAEYTGSIIVVQVSE